MWQIKCFLEQLQHIYNELRDENEFAIIEEYGCSIKRFTNLLTGNAILVYFYSILTLGLLFDISNAFVYLDSSFAQKEIHVEKKNNHLITTQQQIHEQERTETFLKHTRVRPT